LDPKYQAIKQLKEELSKHLNWHGARIDFLARVLLALITVQTVNLSKIANAFGGYVKPESAYKRLQRFFKDFELDYEVTAKFLSTFVEPLSRWVLVLDRTNWDIGSITINILFLGVDCGGNVAFPLMWVFLPKKGNSDTTERIQLMERFVKTFGKERIQFVAGDREFIGEAWLKWLKDNEISYRLRIKKNTLIEDKRGVKTPAWKLFQNTKPKTLNGTRFVWGCEVHLAGCRLENDDYLIVISDTADSIFEDYAKRWSIENLFGCLKSRGFKLEDTHMKDLERLNKLVALLAIAFAWSYRTGEWSIKQGDKIPFKKTVDSPLKSIFRHGLDKLHHAILNLYENFEELISFIQLLSGTVVNKC